MPPLAKRLYDQYQGVPVARSRSGVPNRWEYVKTLKDAAEEAELKRMVIEENIRNGHLSETQVPLYKRISSHTARHTAASRIREAESYELAQLLLGHAAPGVTARYAHLDLVRTAERILRAWLYYDDRAGITKEG